MPPRDGGLAFFVVVAMLVLSLRFDIGPVALIGLYLVGIQLRIFTFGVGFSDVDDVTRAAIGVVLDGGNPYGIGYAVSEPPGASFPYGPLALLWYLPVRDPRVLELVVSGLILGVLALRGRPLGVAIWATCPIFVQLASDGSNDTSAGLMLLVALVILERLPLAGALLVGLAAGFKIYALAWLPPILAWAGAGAFLVGALGGLAVWLPAIATWGADSVFTSFRMTDDHKVVPYFSLADSLRRLGIRADRTLLTATAYGLGALTALATFVIAKSHRAVVVSGILIFMVTLYAGWWSTAAYLAAIAPVLCWYVDIWLGPRVHPDEAESTPDPTRIRWPGDPVGRLSGYADRRWPVAERA